MQQSATKPSETTSWSIQQQEFAIERSLFWAGYFSLLMAAMLCRQIAIHWLDAPTLASWLEAPQIFLSIYLCYRLFRQPGLIVYKNMTDFKADWRANFPDEYLRHAFLQASNKGYQCAVAVIVIGATLTLSQSQWFAKFSQWLPGAILLPLAGLAGTLGFYLSLRAALQEETAE